MSTGSAAAEEAAFELFHEIADAASAEARRCVVDLGIKARVDFRNVAYDEHRADWSARGGQRLPALWDGSELVQGLEAVSERLRSMGPKGDRDRTSPG